MYPATTSTSTMPTSQPAQPASSVIALPEVTSTPASIPPTSFAVNTQASSDVVDPVVASPSSDSPQSNPTSGSGTDPKTYNDGNSASASAAPALPDSSHSTIGVDNSASPSHQVSGATSSANAAGIVASILGDQGTQASVEANGPSVSLHGSGTTPTIEPSSKTLGVAGAIASLLGAPTSQQSQGVSAVNDDPTAATNALSTDVPATTQAVGDSHFTSVVISTAGQVMTLVGDGSQAAVTVGSTTLSLGSAGVVVDGTTTIHLTDTSALSVVADPTQAGSGSDASSDPTESVSGSEASSETSQAIGASGTSLGPSQSNDGVVSAVGPATSSAPSSTPSSSQTSGVGHVRGACPVLVLIVLVGAMILS